MGLNIAAASGILANIQAESGFNPNLYGDSGSSYGICQWHNDRFTALKNYTDKWDTLQGQLEYLHYELRTNYPNLWNSLKSASNNANGAYQTAYDWCIIFENALICIIWRFPEAILPKILIGQNMQEQSFQAMILSQFPEHPHRIR